MTIFGIMQSNSFHFIFLLRTLNMHLFTSSLADYELVAKLVRSDGPTATLRLHLVRVKVFSKNISFFKNVIFWKRKCIQVFGCVGIRFTENQFSIRVVSKVFKIIFLVIFSTCNIYESSVLTKLLFFLSCQLFVTKDDLWWGSKFLSCSEIRALIFS